MSEDEDLFIGALKTNSVSAEEGASFNESYCEDFISFFITHLEKAGISLSNEFIRKLYYYRGPYIRLSDYFSSTQPFNRASLDRDLFADFLSIDFSSKEISLADVTRLYREKVNFEYLFSLLNDPSIDTPKKNILLLILQLMDPECIEERDEVCTVKDYDGLITIGTCEMAERHLMAYLSGEHLFQSEGVTTLITDNEGNIIMIKKEGELGSESCLTLCPIRLGNRYIPAGAVLQPLYKEVSTGNAKKINWPNGKIGAYNNVAVLEDFDGFMFARMHAMSVPEELRASGICGEYYDSLPTAKGKVHYDWVTLDIIRRHASHCIQKYGTK